MFVQIHKQSHKPSFSEHTTWQFLHCSMNEDTNSLKIDYFRTTTKNMSLCLICLICLTLNTHGWLSLYNIHHRIHPAIWSTRGQLWVCNMQPVNTNHLHIIKPVLLAFWVILTEGLFGFACLFALGNVRDIAVTCEDTADLLKTFILATR